MAHHPEVTWSQRSSATDEARNVVYCSINLPDVDRDTLKYDLTPTGLSFKATAGLDPEHTKEWSLDLEFNEEIVPEKSVTNFNARSLAFKLQKKNLKSEYWPRLTKTKNNFVKTDFERWVDEDEQDGAPMEDDFDMDGMGGMGGMGGMPGMGGMGGMPGMGGMGGMPGMGGMGDMDLEKMMANIKSSGPSASAQDDGEDSSEDEGPPPLEDVEPTKKA